MVFGSQDIWKMQTHPLSACRREGQPGALILPDFETSQLSESQDWQHIRSKRLFHLQGYKFISGLPIMHLF